MHVSGNAVDLYAFIKLCKKKKIKIVEDAAEALGTFYNNGALKQKHVGTVGDIGCLSFNGNKIITSGGGGMIITNNKEFAEEARYLSTQATDDSIRYIHNDIGYNYRLTNIQAAVGLAQTERLDEFIKIKRSIGQKYTAFLKDIENIQLPLQRTDYAENIYWVYGLVLDKKLPDNAETFMKKLKQLGIGTRPFFWPMHEQPVLKKYDIHNNLSYPVAERMARNGFYIPSGLALTDIDIKNVSEAIHSIIN